MDVGLLHQEPQLRASPRPGWRPDHRSRNVMGEALAVDVFDLPKGPLKHSAELLASESAGGLCVVHQRSARR